MNWATNEFADIVSVINCLEESTTENDLFKKLTDFTSSLGFEHATLGLITNPTSINDSISKYGLSNFPEEFNQKWVDENYIIHDPVIRYALLSNTVFDWKLANEHATRFGKKIYAELSDFSIVDGICIPIQVGHFPKGMISVSHKNPNFSTNDLTNLQLVCIHAYTKYLKLTNVCMAKEVIELTKREVDVLHYVASGKTNWEIGKILDISEDGVKKHMHNITNKLDAANRTHAVTIGMRSGQILP